jgi:PadR family transcriptional regulator PadR
MPKGRSEVLQGTLDLRQPQQRSISRTLTRGWICSMWGASENNRKARFYSITKAGRKQLAREAEGWERIARVIGRVLRLESQH